MADEGASWIKRKEFWILLIIMIVAGTILRAFVPGLAEVIGFQITEMVNTIFGSLAGIFFLLGFLSYEKSSKELFVETVIPILLFVAILSQSFGVDMGLTIMWVIVIILAMSFGNFANKFVKHKGKEMGGAVGAGISGSVGGEKEDWEGDDTYKEWKKYRKKLLKKRDEVEKLLDKLDDKVDEWEDSEGDEKKKLKKEINSIKRNTQAGISDLEYMKDRVKDVFRKDKKVKEVEEKLGDFEEALEKLEVKIS